HDRNAHRGFVRSKTGRHPRRTARAAPMNRFAPILLLLAAACTGEHESAPAAGAAGEVEITAGAAVADPTAGEPQPPADPSDDDGGEAAPPACPSGAAGGGAAAAVARGYYAAIAARDYARAYRLWGDGGAASGKSFEQFRAGFAQTAAVTATVGAPGRVEGAAGSRYVSVPVEVHATTTGGATQCFRGTYTLRRAVVPGATAEQRRWHIASADMQPCAGSPAPGAETGGGGDARRRDPAGAAGGAGESGSAAGGDDGDELAAHAADLVRRFGQRL